MGLDRHRPQDCTATPGAVKVGASTVVDGRGVFACRDFAEGDVIEHCHVIILGPDDRKRIDDTDLYNYYFDWAGRSAALALGNGSLYNHSYDPNARYIKNQADHTIDFVAIHPIADGDEILVNYNGDPVDVSPVWFEAKA